MTISINLCFHGIGTCRQEREPGEAEYWIAEDLFLRVLDTVADRPQVRLSFDDGNRSDIEIGFPALSERGLSADFFVLAGRLDDPKSLDPGELKTLHAAGMRIGSHGWKHVPWQRLEHEQAQREFIDARTALREASGAPIEDAAAPLGRYDRASLGALRRAGYRTVFTSDRFRARSDAWLQPRYSLTARDTIESVTRMLDHSGIREGRNRLASIVKRWR